MRILLLDRERLLRVQEEIKERRAQLNRIDTVERIRNEISAVDRAIEESRKEANEKEQLMIRTRRILVSELVGLFRVRRSIREGKEEIRISQFRFSFSRDNEENRDKAATALGTIVHFLHVLSAYLGCQLVFPVSPLGSRSVITAFGDQIPLYFSTDARQYVTAVTYLNTNILVTCASQGIEIEPQNTTNTMENIVYLCENCLRDGVSQVDVDVDLELLQKIHTSVYETGRSLENTQDLDEWDLV